MGIILSVICAVIVAAIVSAVVGECSSLYMYNLEIPKRIVREEGDSDTYWERCLQRYKEKVKECRNAWLLRIIVPTIVGVLTLFGYFYIGYRVNMGSVKSYEAKVATYNAAIENDNIECQTAHCGRGKPHFNFGEYTSQIVPYRHLPQILGEMTADYRSLV